MQHLVAVLLIGAVATCLAATSTFQAGVSKVDASLPIGVPLAGYNYPPRRAPDWPLPHPTNYTTWMTPSVGRYDPTWVRALFMSNGIESFCFVSLDAIGADGTLGALAYDIAVGMGFKLPRTNVLISASHSHSQPGGIGPEFLWSFAPATDLMVPSLQRAFATSIATAMVEAQTNLAPALIDFGMTNLTGVTHNRRYGLSPYVQYNTVDTHLGVIRVDTPTGSPLATLWNFAIHGICYDSPNLNVSGDVMGCTNDWVEANVGGVSMFMNGDAGDVNPIFSVCCNNGPVFSGGAVIGAAIQNLRGTLKPTNAGITMANAANIVDFGLTKLNMTLQRIANCTHGGQLDICSICEALHCDLNAHLGSNWVETVGYFNAFAFDVNGKSTIITSIPGEALTALGWEIRNDTQDLGFDQTFLAGYSNNHMGYFATPDEYDIGGYESLLTFWGYNTTNTVRAGCYSVTSQVASKLAKAKSQQLQPIAPKIAHVAH